MAIGMALIGGLVAPFIPKAALAGLGFTASGISAGSIAASWMASYGGTVAAGSALSICQSIGAAGLGLAGKSVVMAITGAGVFALFP